MTNDELDVATDVNAFDVVKFVIVLNAQKKSAWTDLDRVSFKNLSESQNVEIKKSAWTGLDKVKKGASSAASVFWFFRTGHLGVADAFCTSMACP
jgi:hypothetical protein